MELSDVLWVLAVFGFWAFVFVLMFSFVWLISRGRDNEETVCDLPDSPSMTTATAQMHT